jgi:hypothetical protein
LSEPLSNNSVASHERLRIPAEQLPWEVLPTTTSVQNQEKHAWLQPFPVRTTRGPEGPKIESQIFEAFRSAEHFITVTHHSRPAEITNSVDYFGRGGAAIREIATMDHQIGSYPLDVRQYCVECREVSMDVG